MTLWESRKGLFQRQNAGLRIEDLVDKENRRLRCLIGSQPPVETREVVAVPNLTRTVEEDVLAASCRLIRWNEVHLHLVFLASALSQ